MEILLVAADRRQAKGIKYGIFCIVIRGVGANFRFVMCWKKSVSLLRMDVEITGLVESSLE